MLCCLAASDLLAQITYVGATASGGSGNVTSVSLDLPALASTGDVLLAQITLRGGGSVSITAPSGWTLLRRDSYGTTISQALYYRVVADGEPTTISWSMSGGGRRAAGGMVGYRGVDLADPIADTAGLSDDTFVAFGDRYAYAPSVTTDIDLSAVINFYGSADGGSSYDPLFGPTERIDYGIGAAHNGITIGVADFALVFAGATGDQFAQVSEDASFVAQSVALNPAATSTLDHIRIEHPGSALTCEPAPITLRACADAACSSEYPDAVTVTLSPASGWSSNPVTFTGNTAVTLSSSIVQTVTLGASASPAADNATRCFAGATETCDLSFADTGFIFSTIPTQVAGTASALIDLRAVRTSDDGTACTAALAGTHDIEFASECVNPTTCAGRQVSIGATPIANNDAGPSSGFGYTPVSLAFDADAKASFVLAYPDVGAIRLFARYTVDTGALLAGNSNAFVVRPAGFTVTGIERSADGFANPAAADASGPRFIAAGEAFSATVTAVTSGGAATPNFGRETAPQGVQLTHSLHAPVGGNDPALDNDSIAGGEFAAGVATVDDLAWGEVGIIRLTASAAGDDYLGTGPVVGTQSGTIGRFVAHHFDVSLSDGCTGSGYTYAGLAAGQPFPVSVMARNLAGATTSNHAGDWARETTLSQTSTIAGTLANPIIDAVDFVGGMASPADVSFSIDDVELVPVDLTLRAIDTDGVSSATVGATEGATELRSGRLSIGNGVGSDLSATLDLPLQVQSWQELSPAIHGWNVESADDCTTLGTANFEFVDASPAATITSVTFADGVTYPNGEGVLTLSPTGYGNADVRGLMSATAPWLQFDWDGNGSPDDPVARAAFGLNPGNPQQIFRREVIPGN